MSNNVYINGIFAEKKEGEYGSYISIGISEQGLEELQALATSAKGWRNLTLTPQKNNPNKFSAKPYVPKTNATIAAEGGKTYGGNDSSSTDDLPF
jgi:hypothetical protein